MAGDGSPEFTHATGSAISDAVVKIQALARALPAVRTASSATNA